MEKISPNRSGKTIWCIEKAFECDAYMVCMNRDEASRVFKLAEEIGKPIRFPITYEELIRRQYYGRGCKAFVIDNSNLLIQYLASTVPVIAHSDGELMEAWEDGWVSAEDHYVGDGVGKELSKQSFLNRDDHEH